jgi:hypothetical protein
MDGSVSFHMLRPTFHVLFLLILVYGRIRLPCLILPPYPCISYCVFEHTLMLCFTTSMQNTYNYIWETSQDPRVCLVTAVL